MPSFPSIICMMLSPTLVLIFPIVFTLSKRNYDFGNRELLAVKMALEEWWNWSGETLLLYGLTTRNLEYITTAKRLNSRQDTNVKSNDKSKQIILWSLQPSKEFIHLFTAALFKM